MNLENLQKILATEKLPKDELDEFWLNFYGFLPAFAFLFAGLGPILAKKTTMNKDTIMIFLILGLIVFFYTVIAKMTEKKLKSIENNLSQKENEDLINNLADKENWKRKKKSQNLFIYELHHVKFHLGFKLTLIAKDNKILINLRNKGSVIPNARMPYLFGFESYHKHQICKKIQLLSN